MKSEMGNKRRGLGYSAQEFAELIRVQIPTMTEARIVKIETARLRATQQEKDLFARLLGCKTFELGII